MKPETCPEADSWRLVAVSDPLDPALLAHLATCRDCRRQLALVELFGALARLETPPPLPEPATLRWRARLLADLERREAAVHRRTRPARWVGAVALLLSAAGVATTAIHLLLPPAGGGPAEAPLLLALGSLGLAATLVVAAIFWTPARG